MIRKLLLLYAALAAASARGAQPNANLVLRLRMPDGEVRRLHASPEDTIADLTQRASEGGAAVQGLAADAGTKAGVDSKLTVRRLKLRNGDFLYARSAAKSVEERARAKVASLARLKSKVAAEASSAAAKATSPFPDLARPPRPKVSKRGMGIAELQALREQVFKVTPQKEANVKKISVDSAAFADFSSFLLSADARRAHRCALMFGTYDEESKTVQVQALFEPPAAAAAAPPAISGACASSDAPSDPQNIIRGLPDPAAWAESVSAPSPAGIAELAGSAAPDGVERACAVAALLGLRPVGWCVSHDTRKHFMSASDVLAAARLQAWEMRALGKVAGLATVTVTMPVDRSAGEVATEAYCVSNRTVQMVHEGIVAANQPNPAGNRLAMSELVLDDNKEVREVDTLGLVNAVPIIQHKGFLRTKFPATNRGNTPPGAADVRRCLAAAKASNDGAVKEVSSVEFIKRLSDFHLLLFISRQVGLTPDFVRLCECVRLRNAKNPVVAKFRRFLDNITAGAEGD